MVDISFLEIAKIIAQKSTCISKQVGAVIVKNGRILSTGYNGTPKGQPHCGEVGCQHGWAKRDPSWGDYEYKPKYILQDRPQHSAWSEINEIHAEQNAIVYAAKEGLNVEGADMYVTISPCHNCAKLIVAAGIKNVYVGEVYDRAPDNWADWLIKNGVNVAVINA